MAKHHKHRMKDSRHIPETVPSGAAMILHESGINKRTKRK